MARLRFTALLCGSISKRLIAVGGLVVVSALGSAAWAQKIIIVNSTPAAGSMDRRFGQIEPTKVDLPTQPIDARGHQDILRVLVAEQGFAMRPLPRGKKGLTLAANGKLSPAGEGYVSEVTEHGLSVKPGDRVVLSNIKIDKEKMIFDINGGPDHKHDFLRHIQVGMGGSNTTNPVVQDEGQEPTGARITLAFSKFVPEVTPAQVKALLSPLISFDMKTPVQAYTDTLPPALKKAILDHKVMVGMSTDMVLFAMGQPESKSREIEGQMPFEEWIYGRPPQDVQFVRINGNRVIRVELAKLGQPLEVSTKDEVSGMMTTDGAPVLAQATHTVEMGDVHRDPKTQSAEAPPTLRAPGEKLPQDSDPNTPGTLNREGPMKPVIFPKDTTKEPARTVDAHPAAKPDAGKKPADDPDDDDSAPAGTAKPADSGAPKQAPDKPSAAPVKPQTPSSNFYSGTPQPARF